MIPNMWLCNAIYLPSDTHYLIYYCLRGAVSKTIISCFTSPFISQNSNLNLWSSPEISTSMATSTLSPATPSQLCSSKNGMFSPSQALMLKPTRTQLVGKEKSRKITCQATSIAADRVPDMEKRKLMNLLLLGALSLPTAGMLVPYATFFAPPGSGGAGGGTIAKDALGNDVVAAEWLKTHGPGDRTLTQGLKGDPTYLVVENDKTLATYGINAVCTHLGCVVPWNAAEKKFICPCHGSQYNNQGRVVRGPAPLSLALAHADIDEGKVLFVPWVETDFRTGEDPWWS